MPYVFQETQVGEPIEAIEFPSLTSEVLEETFAQTFEENPIMAMARAKQLGDDYRSGNRLDAATARQKLADRGMENDIKVSDAGIPAAALDTLIERKAIEKRRQEIFGQAGGGIAQGAARLGVGLATSLVDPVSVATAFIPVVGEARYLNWLGRAGGVVGRTGVRAGVGAIEGVAGAALLEPIIAGSRRYEQADYDMADSLMNVAFGGLFGAGLHSVGGAVSDGVTHYRGADPAWRGLENLTPAESQLVLNLRSEIERGMDVRDIGRVTEGWTAEMRRAVEPDLPKATPAEAFHQALPPIVRENALKQAIVQAVTDEPVNVTPIVERAAAKQTETPEFRRWFQDSRVVDEQGSPLVVNHGTWADFDEFDFGRLGETTDANASDPSSALAQTARMGAWFSSENVAETIGAPRTVKAYLSLQNPREFGSLDELTEAIDRAGDAASLRAELEADGHDGIRLQDEELGGTSYVAFRPNQIKSATNNSGRFDANSASLTDPLTDVAKATEYAKKILARETDTGTHTADVLKNATEEADLAQSDLKALAERLGEDAEDAELTEVLQAAANSERWARAAELATVCLVRGG
jgi:hypothetical protein